MAIGGEFKAAIVTDAESDSGQEITKSLIKAGYYVVMVCLDPEKGWSICNDLKQTFATDALEVLEMDLSSRESVFHATAYLLRRNLPVSLLMNNAEIVCTTFRQTEDKAERTVSLNYTGAYLFTRRLLPLIQPGGRIVNNVTPAYREGKIELPFLLRLGGAHAYQSHVAYNNSKLALLYFTLELAERLRPSGITVNAAVQESKASSNNFLYKWFDPLTERLRSAIQKKPLSPDDTSIYLLLSDRIGIETGGIYSGIRKLLLPEQFGVRRNWKKLWDATEKEMGNYLP